MGVRSAGALRLGRRRFEPWQLLVMAVAPGPAAEGGQTGPAAEGGQTGRVAEGGQTNTDSDPAAAMEWVHSAAAEGADMVEVLWCPRGLGCSVCRDAARRVSGAGHCGEDRVG